MVSLDIFLNETTRHADVILPSLSPLEQSHYDVLLRQLAVRNVATYAPPVFAVPEGQQPEWCTILRLVGIVMGQGPNADVDGLDDSVALQLAAQMAGAGPSPVAGREANELVAALSPRRGPERLLDLLLRSGPYGDGFGTNPSGLTLAALEASPHGVDFGPLAPRMPEVLRTPSGRIELAPDLLVDDVARLRAGLTASVEMVLIGRRDVRSNNSWMHNSPVLMKGRARCTVHVHPADAARYGLRAGGLACVTSAVGSITVPVEVTDAIRPGVVSIPHGWGHDAAGMQLAVAAAHPGANCNRLVDEHELEPLSGTAVLNGVPVSIAPA